MVVALVEAFLRGYRRVISVATRVTSTYADAVQNWLVGDRY